MLQISQYDFSDNPNLPRILDSAKRDFDIDLELDFVIEQVGDCLRLIGKRAIKFITGTFIPDSSGVIKLPCNTNTIQKVEVCNNPINFTQTIDNKIIIDKSFGGKEVEVTYTDYREDKNGFPFISTDQEYYACLHWIVYKIMLRRFTMGIEKGERLQLITTLKDKYINQARITITSSDMQKIVDVAYSTYARNSTKYMQ